jgi:hypothetical protein
MAHFTSNINDPVQVPDFTKAELKEIKKEVHKDHGQNIPKFNGDYYLQFKDSLLTWINMKGLFHHLVTPLDRSKTCNYVYMHTRDLTKFLLHNTISNKILGEHPACKDLYKFKARLRQSARIKSGSKKDKKNLKRKGNNQQAQLNQFSNNSKKYSNSKPWRKGPQPGASPLCSIGKGNQYCGHCKSTSDWEREYRSKR